MILFDNILDDEKSYSFLGTLSKVDMGCVIGTCFFLHPLLVGYETCN